MAMLLAYRRSGAASLLALGAMSLLLLPLDSDVPVAAFTADVHVQHVRLQVHTVRPRHVSSAAAGCSR